MGPLASNTLSYRAQEFRFRQSGPRSIRYTTLGKGLRQRSVETVQFHNNLTKHPQVQKGPIKVEPDPKVLESLQKQEKSQAQLAGHIDGKGPHES